MKRWMTLGLGLAGLAATPAQADENYFGYSYGAETLPKGAAGLNPLSPFAGNLGPIAPMIVKAYEAVP